MSPIRSEKDAKPKAAASVRRIAGSTLVGVGVLTLTVTPGPTLAFGKNPVREPLAATRPVGGVERNLQAAPLAPVPGSTSGRQILPHSSGPLPMRTARNLLTGHSLALEMVRENPSCSALFADFATSGVEKMAHTFYVAPSKVENREFCVGGVTAFTQVGSRVTRLCPAFGEMDRRNAALTLIHEALHSAGMRESPSTRDAMTPGEINDLVGMACGL